MSMGDHWVVFRKACGVVDKSATVRHLILLLIIVQAVSQGVQASSSATIVGLERLNLFCVICYTVEIVLQIVHHGFMASLKKPWLLFDILVVLLSWGFEIMVLRSIRVLSAVRLTSRIGSLQEILKALVGIFPSLAAILCLLLLVLYIYAVLCTNLFAHLSSETDEDYFGGMDKTLFTLFQLMTLSDWNHVVEQIAVHYSWARYIFMVFLVVTSFILYSLITAVVCQVVADPHYDRSIDHPRLEALLSRIAILQDRQAQILQQCQRLKKQQMVEEEEECIVCIESMNTNRSSAATPESCPSTPPETAKTHWFDQLRAHCGDFVNHFWTQCIITSLIFLNAITMGIGTFDVVDEHDATKRAFDVLDRIFLIIFTLELVLLLLHHCSLGDSWLRFDLCVVIASWSFEQLQVARAVRVLRIVRLGAKMETLRELLQALVDVAPSLSAIISFLMLIIYIYAVLCTDLLGDVYKMGLTDQDYFGRMDKSLFTLFQMTTLENWSVIVRQIEKEYIWVWPLFGTFVILTSFILFSIMIAVLCDVVAQDDEKIFEAEALVAVHRMGAAVEKMTLEQLELLRMVTSCQKPLSISDESLSSSSSTCSKQWAGCLVATGSTEASPVHVVIPRNNSLGSDEGGSDSSIVVEITGHLVRL